MQGRQSTLRIQMNEPTRTTLQKWLSCRKTPAGLARRARAMLLLAEGRTSISTARQVGLAQCHVRKWAKRFASAGSGRFVREASSRTATPVCPGSGIARGQVCLRTSLFASLALATSDCAELARHLKVERVVRSISPETIRRILRSHKLKPWRHHLWLSVKVPRDAGFAQFVRTLVDLYTRPLADNELVLCVDEKTNRPAASAVGSYASGSIHSSGA